MTGLQELPVQAASDPRSGDPYGGQGDSHQVP